MTDRRIGILFLGFLAVAGVLLVLSLMIAMAGGFGFLEIIWRLLTGFASFLRVNLPRISSDAGTWGPGLAAFGLALVVGHFFLRGWARKRNRPWSAGSTLCAGLVLPLLFAISFLVPGVLLQVERLAEVRWFGVRSSESSSMGMRLWSLYADLLSVEEAYGRFPDSLEELVDWYRVPRASSLWMGGTGEVPAEPPIYFGAGLTSESDPSLPLLISPRYLKNDAKMRQVLSVGGEMREIRDEEVDAWIDKAMAAGKR